jgi:hypothetical protein
MRCLLAGLIGVTFLAGAPRCHAQPAPDKIKEVLRLEELFRGYGINVGPHMVADKAGKEKRIGTDAYFFLDYKSLDGVEKLALVPDLTRVELEQATKSVFAPGPKAISVGCFSVARVCATLFVFKSTTRQRSDTRRRSRFANTGGAWTRKRSQSCFRFCLSKISYLRAIGSSLAPTGRQWEATAGVAGAA